MSKPVSAENYRSSNSFRSVVVSERSFRVPRHVVRCGTGWQVRFQEPSKYFSDSAHGSVMKSLRAAKDYLESIWQPAPITPRKCPPVRFIERTERGRAVFYAEVSAPTQGMAPVRVYIGTVETTTKKRQQAASVRAKQAWARLVD